MIRRRIAQRLVWVVIALVAAAGARTTEAQTLSAVLSGQAPSHASAKAPAQVSMVDPTATERPALLGDALFGTLEFTSASLEALPQWRRVVDAMAGESAAMAACTGDQEDCASPALRSWRDLQLQARDLDRREQLDAVNQFFNRWPYKFDSDVYGRREYWASPSEFMADSGDCEDYAIAKYFALCQLGFDKQELRIVVLYDRIRNVGHAVLAVYDGEDILILDSLSNLVTSHTRYRHYIPQYSMNETTRWAHVDQNRAIPQTALRALDN